MPPTLQAEDDPADRVSASEEAGDGPPTATMNGPPSRRGSAAPHASAGNAPPAPPPLPAPRPLQRFRDAASSLLGYQSRPTSPSTPHLPAGFIPGGLNRRATLGATQNATASHKTGLEINTIAINEKGTLALLGGKEIFKTLRIENGTCVEDVNLRSAVRSTPTQASGRTRQIYSIDIADVAWAKGDCGNFVAAATSSGKIILYDVGHAGIQAAQLHEHFRQVHKVTFNPHRGSLLLSGSQDGTVRLWDVRDVREAQAAHSLPSKRKFSGQSDGVRDVKWSPTDGVDFAFGTDSGWIQRWDIRNLQQPKIKIPAHSLAINAIDWHADGKHIASGSLDKTVKVWDVSGNKRQQRAAWEVTTPYPVFNARWRPVCDNGEVRYCAQLATSYDREHPAVHVWDLRRPSLPFRELEPYPTASTDFIWHSQDLLWTVGREGVFLQNDIQHAPKVISRRNLQAVDVSATSEVNIVTQKRNATRTPNSRQRNNDTTAASEPPPLASKQASTLSRGSSFKINTQDQNFLSRSWADDSLSDSFLASTPPSQRRRKSKATPPLPTKPKSRTQSLSMPPPPGHDIEPLDITMMAAGRAYRPRQQMWTLPLPLALSAHTWRFLAREYKMDLSDAKKEDDFLTAYEDMLTHNSQVADAAGLYRLAQEWRILAFSIITHLNKRVNALPAEDKPTHSRSFDAVRASLSIDVEEGAVFEVAEMVKRIVNYHIGADGSGKGNAQVSCVMVLLLSPVLPQTHPLPSAEADATVDYFLATYADAGFAPETMEAIIDDHIQPLLRASLQPMQVESLLSRYHDQLITHQLFAEAAELRRIAYPAFPAIYEDWVGDNSSIRLACGACGAEMLQARDKRRCDECRAKAASCAICWLEKSPFESADGAETTLVWTACLRCGHRGHDACLRRFWAISDSQGRCPTQGCLCDCAGHGEKEVGKADEKVKKDEWAAGPSKAVEEAVGALSLRGKQ